MFESDAAGSAVASPLIAGLFARDVIASELRGPGARDRLHPREAAQCAGFAPGRIAEFAAGRSCARRALAELGITNFALDANADRSPRWPENIAGSITHTRGFCAAVVGRTPPLRGIGIDAETIGRVTPDIHHLIFDAEEARALATLDVATRMRAQTIVFSAKEAFYKCQYPITRAWRDFHDVTIELTSPAAEAGDFTVNASSTTSVTDWGLSLPIRGRFAIEYDLVVTGIAIIQSEQVS